MSGDHYEFEKSQMSQGGMENPYSKRSWAQVPDSNSGLYNSNTIKFSLTSLYNSDAFNVFSESALDIPIVVCVSGVGGGMPISPMQVGLKNGYYASLIQSVQIQYDNKQVEQFVPNKMMYTSFKMMSEMSLQDEANIGPLIGFAKDSPTTWSHLNAPTKQGCGLVNNVAFVDATYPDETKVNKGFQKRLLSVHDPTKYANLINEAEGFITNSKSFTRNFNAGGVAGNAQYQVYYFNACIRLKDISDFIANMPIIKGGLLNIELTVNTGSLFMQAGDFLNGGNVAFNGPAPVAPAAAGANNVPPAVVQVNGFNGVRLNQNMTQFSYRTCPFMVCPVNSAAFTADNVANTEIIVGCYIGKVTSSIGPVNQSTLGVPEHTRRYCSIYVPQVQMQPGLALKYIEEHKQSTVEYEVVEYSEIQFPAGSRMDKTLSESCTNATGVLLIPQLTEASNGGLDPISSPFDTAPATTCPLSLHNYQVQLNGTSLYPESFLYDYSFFLQEIASLGLNGNKELGLGSGLIDLVSFQNNYKYYYTNLQRRLTDNIQAKTVRVSAYNNTRKDMIIYAFLVTKKSCVIDVETGKLLAMSNTAI